MVEIVSENAEIEREVAKLCELLVKHGGMVDERLIIKEEGGNLSILAPPEIAKSTKILRAPHSTLLFIDQFEIAVEGSDFVLKNVDAEANEGQRALMDSMLRIYNLCGKVDDFKKYATVNLYNLDRPLLDRILNATAEQYQNLFGDKDFILSGFMRMRTLGTKIAGADTPRPALMPVIDFMNHNISAGNFSMQKQALEIHRSSREGGTSECFVRYGPYDALDMLNTYGFVDEAPCFVYARPMRVELPGVGEINVLLQNRKHVNKKLPDTLQDLRSLFPPLQRVEGTNTMAAGFLRIPAPEAPRALRRVIQAIVGFLTAGDFPANTTEVVNHAETQIVEGTRTFYQDLKTDMENYNPSPELAPLVDNVRRLAEVQLSHLSKYDYDVSRSPRPGFRRAGR